MALAKVASWDFAFMRRNSPTPSVESSTSDLSATSTASTTSIPIVYDSKTSKVEALTWDNFEQTEDLVEAEAEGTGLNAELKLNIGSEDKPIYAHFAYVNLANLKPEVKHERRMGRINSIFVRA